MNRSEVLAEFLEQTPVRTGTKQELVALAEMAGYGTQDANDLGHPNLFDAVDDLQLRKVSDLTPQGPAPVPTLRVALLRGLTYLSPALAILSLYPSAPQRVEIAFIVVVLALGWAYGQQMTFVVNLRLPLAPRLAWRRASLGASAVVLAALLGGWALVGIGVIDVPTAVIAVLYAVTFAAAGPLMARPVNRGLLAVVLAAGVAAIAVKLTGSMVATTVVILGLLMPLALLVFAWVRTPRAPDSVVAIPLSRRAAHATYGVSSAALVGWLPIMLFGTSVVTLSAVNLAALGFTEVAVLQMRRRIEHLLGRPFHSADFKLTANRIVLSGLLISSLPVAVVTVVLAGWLIDGGLALTQARWGVAAVVLLSIVQMLGLILTTLHGVMWAAGGVLVGAVILWLRAGSVSGMVEPLLWYVAILTILALTLLAFALRRSTRPLNYL